MSFGNAALQYEHIPSYGACQACGRGKSRRKSKDAKRTRSFDGTSSNNRLEIQDKPRFKNQVSSKVHTKFPKASGDRVSNPKLKKGRGTNSSTEKPTCGKYGKKYYADCLKGWTIVFVVVKVSTRLGIA